MVAGKSSGGSCHRYHVPQKSHRIPIASMRIKQGFNVVDMACVVSVTHRNVENLRMTLSSYTPNSFDGLGQETRTIVLKDFQEEEESAGAGGGVSHNFTDAVFADFGDQLKIGEQEAPYTGVWMPTTPFKSFIRGWGKRTSIGGSRGMWTLEVEAVSSAGRDQLVSMFSEELPHLESWTVYLCAEGESLRNTPEVDKILRSQRGGGMGGGGVYRARWGSEGGGGGSKAPLVRAFSGGPSPGPSLPPSAGLWGAQGLGGFSLGRVARTALGWSLGAWMWRAASEAARAGSSPLAATAAGSHLEVHNHDPGHAKTIIEHFDKVAHNDDGP
ncbi:hypothetical protein HOP50_05g35840 [Chloropicon primus]|uniref:Uncharacterized protein n=1 Tax=Chloropicon primus TaxID=1764295 RepID=A0A5B8MKY6_9CHLO|nr:hypothetical protein A3770_05p35770 [Chloropicon primus]UPR00270.1 hypothetical protein HOP50_05g35840 [Chloropicon primus]|eukprot:QDZ21059.1 hypothetical protein A3770_05p35770 [Chloropicon primus]